MLLLLNAKFLSMLVVLLFPIVMIFTLQLLEKGVLVKLMMQFDDNVLMQVNIKSNRSVSWKFKAALLCWCHTSKPFPS